MNTSDTLTVLRRARKLLTPDGAWIQRLYAQSNGHYLPKCFCLLGAINQAARNDAWDEAFDEELIPLKKTLNVRYSDEIATWNDQLGRTQAEVLAVLDSAIATAEPATPVED